MPEDYGDLGLVVPTADDYNPGQADVPRAFREFTDSIDPMLAGAKGEFLIVQNTGAPAAKAMKGNATLAEDGTLTIADAAITARMLKLEHGIARPAADFALAGEAYVDLPGANFAVHPLVASKLIVILWAGRTAAGANGRSLATLRVDKEAEQAKVVEILETEPQGESEFSQLYSIALPAGEHTVTVRVRATNGFPPVISAQKTRALWALVAA